MNEETTEPGIKAKAKKLNKKADPIVDRALYAISSSEWSAVWIVCVVICLIGFGLWLRG